MILLLEYPGCLRISSERQESRNEDVPPQYPTWLPAPGSCTFVWTLCWDQPRGIASPLSRQNNLSALVNSQKEKSPTFLWPQGIPQPEKGMLKYSTQHLTMHSPIPVRRPRTVMPLKISKRKRQILLCSPGSRPGQRRKEVVMRIEESRVSALPPISLHQQPQPCKRRN